MPYYEKLKTLASRLEIAALACALGGLIYRATIYWKIPLAPGEPYGLGDLIDFGLGIVVFAVCFACAATGVGLNIVAERKLSSYRTILIGMGCFLVYYFVHPHLPRLLS